MRFIVSVLAVAFSIIAFTPAALATSFPHSLNSPFQSGTGAAQSVQKLAEYFQSKGDRRGQFAQIYAITIAQTMHNLKQGAFENPKWVETLIVNYANIYRRTIVRELSGKRGQLPVAWQNEFDYVEREDWIATFDVIYGIKVHITRDLVEALYVTPTEFGNASIRRDFFRISDALESAMPQIWAVYLYYSHSLPVMSQFTSGTVFEWIARLRARAWEDARRTAKYSSKDKAFVLQELDRKSKRIRHFGILALFH